MAVDQHFIGVDVGTGSARAGVFDVQGTLKGVGRQDIQIWRDSDYRIEQSGDNIWAAVGAAIRAALHQAGLASRDIVGIGFDATCSLVLIDRDGGPVAAGPTGDDNRNVIVWMDHRAREQAERINASGHRVLDYVGGRISPEMETSKLLWLAENMPDSFSRAAHFMDLTDYLTWRATGSPARSICTLACKWSYLPNAGGWQADFFEEIGLDRLVEDGFERVGQDVVAPGTALATGLTEKAAADLGLAKGTVVAAGLIDAHAGALGTIGAPQSQTEIGRRLAYVFGTSACTLNVTEDPAFVPGVWGPYESALLPGLWLNEGGQTAAGSAIDALLKLHPMSSREDDPSSEVTATSVDSMAVDMAAMDRFEELTRGLHIVPEFLGNRAPYADPDARAIVSGLSLASDRVSLVGLYLAGLASIGYGLGQIIGSLQDNGIACELIVISGGAGVSPIVRQVLADATGRPVAMPVTAEPVLLGSAMLATVARGAQPDLMEAAMKMSSFAGVTQPDPDRRDFHAKRAAIFAELQAFQRRTRDQ